ncbi:metallophosphoesterase family protein [Gimesia aquarii]|nr:metallophosphoesterase family protein [Gimesia aquarii]
MMEQSTQTGRTIVIGDIHGCDVALGTILYHLELTRNDTFICLGDVVDRGPGTKHVVEMLLDVKASCRFVMIKGNHEEMMLDGLNGGHWESTWLQHGGKEALDSYGGRYDLVPEEHRIFLANALDYYETETDIFVHAKAVPGVPLEDLTTQELRWDRLKGDEEPDPSGRRIICGHTAQKSGKPLVFEGWVCLDTCAYRGNYLTAIDVHTNEMFQAKQSGKYSSGKTLERYLVK